MKQILLACLLLVGNFARALSATDVIVSNGAILFQGKAIHPGCFRALSSELNGDAVTMVVNIEFVLGATNCLPVI